MKKILFLILLFNTFILPQSMGGDSGLRTTGVNMGGKSGMSVATVVSGGTTYLADAQAYFDTVEVRGGAITTARKDTINTFFQMLHDSLSVTNVREAFDRLWLLANQDTVSALTSLANPSSTKAIGIASPTFAYNRGFAGNGTTSYINTLYIANSDGLVYTQNSASIGFYSNTEITETAREMGDYDAAGVGEQVFALYQPDGNAYGFINSDGNAIAVAQASSIGLFSVARTASTTVNLYKNGSSIGNNAAASVTPLSTINIYLGVVNNAGTLQHPSTKQIPFAFIGKGFSTAEQLKIWHCVQWYLNTLGFGI